MDRNAWIKATEVSNVTDHPSLADASSFKEAFPEIKNVNVVVKEKGDGVISDLNETKFSENSFRGIVECSNPICNNGGISIEHIVRIMAGRRESDFQMAKACSGYDGSQKGRINCRSCLNTFVVKIHINYN